MSRYLVRRIEENPAINLKTCTEIWHSKGISISILCTGETIGPRTSRSANVRHIFVMTGAAPDTSRLDGCVLLDTKGFIKTGTDLWRDDLTNAHWPPTRPPNLLETSLPGVLRSATFARATSSAMAWAVGEASIAAASIHPVLRE